LLLLRNAYRVRLCQAFTTGANWIEFNFVPDLGPDAGRTIGLRTRLVTDGVLSSAVCLDSLSPQSHPTGVGGPGIHFRSLIPQGRGYSFSAVRRGAL
jgi:hypothetical protein